MVGYNPRALVQGSIGMTQRYTNCRLGETMRTFFTLGLISFAVAASLGAQVDPTTVSITPRVRTKEPAETVVDRKPTSESTRRWF